MELNSGFDKLDRILRFVQKKPTASQLIAFLSDNVCPLGEPSGVAIFSLDDDGLIKSEGYYGFHKLNVFDYSFRITDDRPGAEALRTLKVIVDSREEVTKKYKDFTDNFHPVDYRTAVAMPVTSRLLITCALSTGLKEFPALHGYFTCVNSLLGFWANATQDAEIVKHLQDSIEDSHILTSRQERILRLIENGKKNSEIGEDLGYSESLIRQETIIIYRKLGVSGRKEIQQNHRNSLAHK